MRPIAPIVLLAVLGCNPTGTPSASIGHVATVKLRVGEGSAIPGSVWTLRLDSLVSDSRCPPTAMCVRAGEVRVALQLASPLADPLPQDSPHFELGATPVTVEGYRFTETEVQPAARIDPIDPKAYVVTISIDNVGS